MFLTRRFYIFAVVVVALYAASFLLPWLYGVARALMWLLFAVTVADMLLLYSRRGITAERSMAERFSNGDDNDVSIHVASTCPFALKLGIIDEVPFVFQRRDILFAMQLQPHGEGTLLYTLRPTRRGSYGFGLIRVFARTAVGLVERRYSCAKGEDVKVYPSYLMLRRYELLAISNRLTDMGVKRMRRAGNNTEFEHIKDYVAGDEYRHINWKASARRHQFMVNVYEDEKSQQVIAVIDKGRTMQQAFRQMTLLDYAINASLMLSFVAVRKDDKAGLITFADHTDTFLAPSKRQGQMERIMDTLYAEQTQFGESDFSELLQTVMQRVRKRSLLVVFTSFADRQAMQRQLPYLMQMSRQHRVLVVFFADNDMLDYLHSPRRTTEDYYRHVIIQRMLHDQQLIVSELRQHGILALLTTPQNLSVDVVNSYLEIKSRELI